MTLQEIKPNVYYVGVIDWDRRLFDELIEGCLMNLSRYLMEQATIPI